MSDNAPKVFKNCYIEDPRILAEKVLNDGIFNGSITFPFVDTSTNKMDADIYTVPFVMDGDFGFSLGNKWDTLVPAGGEFLDKLASLASFANLQDGQPMSQVRLISRAMSVATWQGSEIPTFSIQMSFVATRRSYNPVKIIKALAASALPLCLKDYPEHKIQEIKQGLSNGMKTGAKWLQDQKAGWNLSESEHPIISGVLDSISKLTNAAATGVEKAGLIAPLFYEPHVDLENDDVTHLEPSTITLQIGQWFRASKLVVSNVSNIQFSRETIAPQPDWLYVDSGNALYHKNLTAAEYQGDWGFPLYAKCTLELRPVTYITYPEFLSYFLECPKRSVLRPERSVLRPENINTQSYIDQTVINQVNENSTIDNTFLPSNDNNILNGKYENYDPMQQFYSGKNSVADYLPNNSITDHL